MNKQELSLKINDEFLDTTSKEILYTLMEEFDNLVTENSSEETLEEVAERLYPGVDRQVDRMLFINGAKWQQQQMYSEDEVLSFGKSCFYKGFEKSEKDDANCYTAFREEIGKLFKQFKK